MPQYDFPLLKKQSRDQKGWIKGCCPLHDDKNPSFSYNPDTGAWKCFATGGCGQGNYKQFLEKYDPAAADRWAAEKKEEYRQKNKPEPKSPPIKESYVKKCHGYLQDKHRDYLYEHRGLTAETVAKYQLGWDPSVQRYTIPVRDHRGKLITVRMYKVNGGRWKMLPFKQTVKGKTHTYGSPARLFGLDELAHFKGEEVIICEGEWDRLLLQQLGFMAVTATNGCRAFLPEWVRHFKDKDVILMFDCDAGGQQAAKGMIIPFFESSEINSIKNVPLPLEGTPEDNDLTDFVHGHAKGPADVRALINSSGCHVYESQSPGEKDPVIILESFIEIERKDNMNKRVQCDLVVSGETSETFCGVEQFKVSHCKLLDDGKCVECVKPINLTKDSKEYIGSCMSTDAQVLGLLRQRCCKFGKAPSIEHTKTVTVKEFFCHQAIRRTQGASNKQELIEKKVYYLSSDHVTPGAYLATGYVKSHPKTQAVTLLIDELIAQEDDYQAFTVSKSLKELEAYREFSLNEIIKDLTDNVTNIYQRDELLLAVLLTFFSPRWIPFNNKPVRGWILSIIIGDSGLGKTQTYSRISDYIAAGDFFSCLTGSRTGLAYALVDSPHRGWQVKIGRYPANSGRLLAVDEVQHLEQKDLQSLSKAMDEGFLQIDKVKSKGYETMTRMLMLCNPKYDRVMDECMYGCEALKTIYPPTILRRVDFAVFANAGDMTDYSVMNRVNGTNARIKPEMLRAAVFWAWNLTVDQIYFEPDAEKMCRDEAMTVSLEFGNAVDIPLVAPSDFRYNLARISAAFACLTMSTEDFKTLIVKKEHIQLAVNFIKMIYRHQSCALDKYSEIVKLKTHLLDYDVLAARFIKKAKASEMNNTGNYFVKIIYQFKINNAIRREELKDFVNCSMDTVKHVISFLKTSHLIKVDHRSGYRKQPKFVKFLRELERNNPKFFVAATRVDDDDEEDVPPWGERDDDD